eukprot:TRINITY_DN12892_c0_g1_i1.p1 TRINITY_DN12892_c0_g1~~TRINITY_DN12892_c0_g1_i1.p1  ORF type:complete len:203 (-),score=16.94 TRINITY_DN12892_c0_g1_i1:58-666(-)
MASWLSCCTSCPDRIDNDADITQLKINSALLHIDETIERSVNPPPLRPEAATPPTSPSGKVQLPASPSSQSGANYFRSDAGGTTPTGSGGWFRVMITKTAKCPRLGVLLEGTEDRTAIKISELYKGGLLDHWNELNPENPLQEGDIIIEANSQAGDYRLMYSILESESFLNLKVRRPSFRGFEFERETESTRKPSKGSSPSK